MQARSVVTKIEPPSSAAGEANTWNPVIPFEALVQVSAAMLPIPLPTHVLRKAMQDDSGT